MDPSIDRLKASDGSGNASVATVQSARSAGATTIQVNTVSGINGKFMGTMGTPHTFTDPVTGETITVISEATAVDFAGYVDGSNLEIEEIADGYTDNGSEVGDIVIIRPTTQWSDELARVLEVSHNDNGTLKDDSVDTDQIVDDAVTTAKIADKNITAAKLGTPIAFRATTTQSTTASSVHTDVTSFTEVFDLGGNFASGDFTAPYDGVYFFEVCAAWLNMADVSRCSVGIFVNDVSVAEQFATSNSAVQDPSVSASVVIELSANDVVEMGVYQDSGTISMVTPSHFGGYLIGRTD